jgi:uncharacterized protein DUF4397
MESVMRRFVQLPVLFLAAGLINACSPEQVIQTEDIPTAGVRFINAVPDTGAMDFRPVDLPENTTFYNVGFRGTALLFYKNATAGNRHFRVFQSPDATLTAEQQIAMAQVVFADTTFNIEAGKRYTFIMWGFSRTGSNPRMKLSILVDDPADPVNQIALRIVNAAAGRGAIDVRQYPNGGVLPATADFANVAELTASAYVLADTGVKKFNVQPAGGGASVFATDPTGLNGLYAVGTVIIGTPNTCPPKDPLLCDLEAQPGTQVAGSAVSGILFRGSVIGSKAPQSGITVSTTGNTVAVLSATATGYSRTAGSGSFISEGFVVGDTVTAQGFANAQNNGPSAITAVAATSLTVTKVGGTVAEVAGLATRRLGTPRSTMLFVWDRRPPRTQCGRC